MHGLIANRAFPTSDTPLDGVNTPAGVQIAAEQSVARFRDLYLQSMATAQGSAKVFAEVAETTWGGAKLLNDKLIQNMTANTEAAFSAAESIARARSLPEAARLQGDFLQMLLIVTGEQMKEFVDLSARVAQHVLETTQVAARRSIQSDL
jgi:hypothetical protein